MSRSARRHYRVTKKKIDVAPSDEIYIPKYKKNKLIALGAALLFVAFLKGFLIGYIVRNNED